MNDATKKIILDEIVPLVTNGEMALFLGAGASIGTPAINGKTIPSTSQLIERICISCGYDKSDYENTDLQTAFGIGQDEIDNFDNFINKFFKISLAFFALGLFFGIVYSINLLGFSINSETLNPLSYCSFRPKSFFTKNK